MFLAQPEDNNAVYRCEANNKMLSEPLTAEITMAVQCKILIRLDVGFQGSNYRINWGILQKFISFTQSYNFVTDTIHCRLQLNAHSGFLELDLYFGQFLSTAKFQSKSKYDFLVANSNSCNYSRSSLSQSLSKCLYISF